MKKLFFLTTIIAALAILITPAMAAKPDSNNAGATTYGWHLSGAVMPVPPYGSMDIVGSDTASKLIVNQPNGKVTANLTGVMKGLHPDTTYTVYLSKGYTPYQVTGWSLNGSWTLDVNSTLWPSGNPYVHNLTVTGDTATGASPGNTYDATVSIVGDNVTIVATYLPGSAVTLPYSYTAVGTISSTGTLSGIWTDSTGDSGTWSSTTGSAIKTYTGDTGFPGLLPGVDAFTFTTDSKGEGSWHYNFKDMVLGSLSAWINETGATILISDSITF